MSQLVRMMPLAVLIPTTGTLSLVLPPGGPVDKDHKPFTNAVTIQRLKDRIEVMTSLMKPKKVFLPILTNTQNSSPIGSTLCV